MDSIISLGQKNTLAEYMILSGVDNRPSMLDKDLVAKDLWERVQLLMQGTSLTKQERECKLYDALDKFTHIKRESLHILPPEWSKFVTDVKLVKDFHTSNYDQLHAYLEQHELHAIESHLNHQTSTGPQVAYQSPQAPTQLMIESPFVDSSFTVPVFSPGDDPIAYPNKTMAFLTTVASSRFPSTNNQLRTSSNIRNQATIQDGRVTMQQVQRRQGNVAWYKEKAMLAEAQEARKILDEEQLAFLADPGIPAAILMANISNYGSDVILEEKANKEQNKESITAELERYKERVKTLEQRISIDLSYREKMIDSQMDDMIKEKLVLKEKMDSLEQIFLNKSQKRNVYWKHSIVEVPSELPKVSLVNESLKKLKFQLAQFDYVVKKRTTPNALTKDLLNEITKVKTVFDQMEAVVQQSSVDKQCLEIANKELLLENDRLSQQIMSQDIVSTVMNCMSLNVDCINVDIQRSEYCEKCLNLDAESSKSKQAYNDLLNNVAKLLSENERLCKEINYVKQIFKDQFDSIKQTCVLQKEQCDSLINKLNLKSAEHEDLKAQIQDKVFVITSLRNDLRKLKGKTTVNNAAQIPSATTVVPGMFKLDLEPLAPKLMHNRESHIFYLKHTQDQADILRGIVEQAKAKQPLENELDFACCPDCTLVSELQMFETHDRESLSAYELCQ
nr:hypothetical protein [Tanacetum cinerariifolium]